MKKLAVGNYIQAEAIGPSSEANVTALVASVPPSVYRDHPSVLPRLVPEAKPYAEGLVLLRLPV